MIYYLSHFIEKETEGQKCQVNCPRSHSSQGQNQDSEADTPHPMYQTLSCIPGLSPEVYLRLSWVFLCFRHIMFMFLSMQLWRHRFPSENDLSAILAFMSRHLTIITFLPPPAVPPNTPVRLCPSPWHLSVRLWYFFSFTSTQLSPFVYISPNIFLSSFSYSTAVFPGLHTLWILVNLWNCLNDTRFLPRVTYWEILENMYIGLCPWILAQNS